MEEVKLPTGVTLKVHASSFSKSKNLYQAIFKEMKNATIPADGDIKTMFGKEVFLGFLSSKEIETAIVECFDKCIYNESPLTLEIFEDFEARENYLDVLFQVTRVKRSPFMNRLYAQFVDILAMLETSLA